MDVGIVGEQQSDVGGVYGFDLAEECWSRCLDLVGTCLYERLSGLCLQRIVSGDNKEQVKGKGEDYAWYLPVTKGIALIMVKFAWLKEGD
jgi:hypothetical protein